MTALTSHIKLNPTNINIRPLSHSRFGLKLGLTTHLLIEDPILTWTIRKDGDSNFEVTVPVGGTIELEIEVDREGLERVGGREMSIIQEIELEEMIREIIMNAFQRVRSHAV